MNLSTTKKFLSLVFILILASVYLFSRNVHYKKRVLWHELTFKEIVEAAKEQKAVIVPAAQIEAHGPHLPTGTDYFLTLRLSVEAARRSNAIVAPR